MSREQKTQKKKKSPVVIIAVIVCLAVFLGSGYKLVSTLLEYKEGEDEYESLRQYTSETKEQQEQAASEEEEKHMVCPIEVDFKSLKAINEDVVGWLYLESLDISYPIVHGKDNDFYLHRTFEKKYNFAGSIFIEWQNKPDFSDPMTIVYGHNMRNGSMFGKLKRLTADEANLEDPHFWILTPEKDYYYEMFSIRKTGATSDVYTLFSLADEQFLKYAEKMASESSVKLPLQTFTEKSKIATLSTCTGDSKTRYVVQGVRVDESEHKDPQK